MGELLALVAVDDLEDLAGPLGVLHTAHGPLSEVRHDMAHVGVEPRTASQGPTRCRSGSSMVVMPLESWSRAFLDPKSHPNGSRHHKARMFPFQFIAFTALKSSERCRFMEPSRSRAERQARKELPNCCFMKTSLKTLPKSMKIYENRWKTHENHSKMNPPANFPWGSGPAFIN